MTSKLSIKFAETSRRGTFTATAGKNVAGEISFVFSGFSKMVVDQLELTLTGHPLRAGETLLEHVRHFAREQNLECYIRCPKAKALSDQQIAQPVVAMTASNKAVA